MAFYLSPLVDVNEIDLTTTIPAVATSIGAIILRETYKGPERKKWLVTSEDDLIETFGQPTTNRNTYEDMLAAIGFFRWGNKLYVTRTMPVSATFSGTKCPTGSGASPASSFTPFTTGDAYILSDFDSEDPDEFADEVTPAAANAFELIAASRGAWGNNIRVAVVDASTYTEITTGGKNFAPWTDDDGTLSALQDTDLTPDDQKDFVIIVESQEQDETSFTRKEEWLVSTQENRVDDEGVTKFAERLINQQSDYIRIAFREGQKNQNIWVATPTWQTFGGGDDKADPNDEIEDGQIMKDIDLYANAEEIDVNIFIDANKSETVKKYLITTAESRLDAVAVLDVPKDLVVNNSGNETEELRNWRNGVLLDQLPPTVDELNVSSSYAALYANWLEVFDKYNNAFRWVPASGHIAGIFARTDDVTDPWFAPAGLQRGTLSNVRRLAWNPTLAQRDILYKNGLNPIISLAGQGKVVFGQKTMLSRNSAFNRINVRRLFIILEKAISTAVKEFLFEPNDEITRLLLLNLIDPFLRDVRSRRGVFDYLIVCDETNNTPERIDRNELWCDIYVKPTRAAEFIVLNFIATKTGASFTEIAALRAGRAT